MMARTNYVQPRFINNAYTLAQVSENDNQLARELDKMTKRHDDLLRAMHSVVDSYNQLLDAHGPFHEIELGEPASRLENILRKALNE